MQLRVARLCLNCEEVHDQQTCPRCSSESFTHISRWVPAPERRARPRERSSPDTADTADIYRRLLDPNNQKGGARRWVTGGILGLGVAAIAGWAWRRTPASAETPHQRRP